MKIPFMKAPVIGREEEYLLEAFRSGYHGGGGVFTGRSQHFLTDMLETKKTLLTTSATDALEMSSLLAEIEPGDEVIVPSYTFSSTANAFVLHGGVPVFADVDHKTLNMDPTCVEKLVTEKTKVICPIHYAGIPADMDPINEIAANRGVIVVEDAAQALGSEYKGRRAGALCDLGVFSFHATKSISCGEGGALTINNEQFLERSEFLWEKGTDRSLVVSGLKNKYSWVDKGSSFLPSDLLAAILFAQLEQLETMQARRRKVFESYFAVVEDFLGKGVRCTYIPEGVKSNYHAFWLLFEQDVRDEFISRCRERDFIPYIGYVPLHSSKMGSKVGKSPLKLPVTEAAGQRLVRLPFYLMEDDEIERSQYVLRDVLTQIL